MNRHDLLAFEAHCRDLYRREARRRAKRTPEAAALLNRLADQNQARIDEIRCGPLFGERG